MQQTKTTLHASTLSDEIAKLKVDLSAAEHSRDALKRELSNEDPQLPADPAAAVAAPSETVIRLEAQKRQLDDLLRRFTDEHPMWSQPVGLLPNQNANAQPK